MAHIYNIKSQISGEKPRLVSSCTRKREIKSMLNRFMNVFSRDPKYSVRNIRIGYCVVTYTCILGSIDTEYWIERS